MEYVSPRTRFLLTLRCMILQPSQRLEQNCNGSLCYLLSNCQFVVDRKLPHLFSQIRTRIEHPKVHPKLPHVDPFGSDVVGHEVPLNLEIVTDFGRSIVAIGLGLHHCTRRVPARRTSLRQFRTRILRISGRTAD